jgi:hypothetical protein
MMSRLAQSILCQVLSLSLNTCWAVLCTNWYALITCPRYFIDRLQVRVGRDKLVGEVIRIEADKATIQVYEETGMLTNGYSKVLKLTFDSWCNCWRSSNKVWKAAFSRIRTRSHGNYL